MLTCTLRRKTNKNNHFRARQAPNKTKTAKLAAAHARYWQRGVLGLHGN